MNVIIGCAPSSGSSLLCQILNRHPELYCGPESNLFIHPELYLSWEKHKNNINRKGPALLTGFKNLNFYVQPKLFLSGDIGYIDSLIDSSTRLKEFSASYFSQYAQTTDKNYWVEKTPANALCFGLIRKEFGEEDIQLAAIVRNPLDSIYSMLRRGMSLYRAVSAYLLYNTHLLSLDGVTFIHYEDLVENPKMALDKFLRKLNLYYYENMEKSPEVLRGISMEGWTYAENENIGRNAVGKFYEAPSDMQNLILYAIERLRIHRGYRIKNDLKLDNIRDISDLLGYSIPAFNGKMSRAAFGQKIWREQVSYLMTRWKAGVFNYGFKYPTRFIY